MTAQAGSPRSLANPFSTNSKDYWDFRFEHDWEAHGGPAQTRFFAELAIHNLPEWFLRVAKERRLSFCDWGSAMGDGTSVLVNAFPGHDVCGIDISEHAVDQATRRFPGIQFEVTDLLARSGPVSFDILYSSNTLEHFADPFGVLRILSQSARHFMILLVPFAEQELFHEHFARFDDTNIPEALPDGFALAHRAVFDTASMVPTYWIGQQVLLIYGKPASELAASYDVFAPRHTKEE